MRTILFLGLSLAASCAWSLDNQIQNSLGMKFVLIPPGEFVMGSDESAEALAQDYPQYDRKRFVELSDEGPAHKVRITPVSYTHLTLPTNREV